jgi:hypothetical protein
MKKQWISLLLLSILFLSCECEKEPENLLTLNEWTALSSKGKIKFNDDNTYIIKTELELTTPTLLSMTYLLAQISGNWNQRGHAITFVSSQVYLFNLDTSTVIDPWTNLPDGSNIRFVNCNDIKYGESDSSYIYYLYLGWNIPGTVQSPSVPMSTGCDPAPVVWNIKKLTKDSLIVECNGEISNYYHEY